MIKCESENCNWFEENTGRCEICITKKNYEREIFKCVGCGMKYPAWFCGSDSSFCRWCSGEEVVDNGCNATYH